jgi:putative Mg2+ transporter-C (MgtC) family protein
MRAFAIGEPTGQRYMQLGELLLALLLCSLIGLERELKQKSAGLRTHTLVGVGAALFPLVSKHRRTGRGTDRARPVPGGGADRVRDRFHRWWLISGRRDAVRGLTTAAVVWTSVAVGCACAASRCSRWS